MALSRVLVVQVEDDAMVKRSLVLLLAIALASCSSPAEEGFTQARNQGEAAFRAGNHAEAIAHYTRALSFKPRDGRTLSSRATCFCFSGDHEEAIKDYTDAISASPQAVENYSMRGDCYKKLGSQLQLGLPQQVQLYELAVRDYDVYITSAHSPTTLDYHGRADILYSLTVVTKDQRLASRALQDYEKVLASTDDESEKTYCEMQMENLRAYNREG